MLTKIVGGQQICRHFEFFCSSLGGGTASQLSFTKVHNQNHISTYMYSLLISMAQHL